MMIEDTFPIRKLNDYILHLKQLNENLTSEILINKKELEIKSNENDLNIQRFLNYIEEQATTIENIKSETRELRNRNNCLISDNQSAFNEISLLQTVVAQKQVLIDSCLNQKVQRKIEKMKRQSLLVEETEQEKVLMQLTIRRQGTEIQHLITQIHDLEYSVKTLKGKIKLNSEANKSQSNLNRHLENAGQITLAKGSNFKKKTPSITILGQESPKARTHTDFYNEQESVSEEFTESVYSLFKNKTEEKNALFFTDDEFGDQKDFLNSLDFQNIPIFDLTEHGFEKSVQKSANSVKKSQKKLKKSEKSTEKISKRKLENTPIKNIENVLDEKNSLKEDGLNGKNETKKLTIVLKFKSIIFAILFIFLKFTRFFIFQKKEKNHK